MFAAAFSSFLACFRQPLGPTEAEWLDTPYCDFVSVISVAKGRPASQLLDEAVVTLRLTNPQVRFGEDGMGYRLPISPLSAIEGARGVHIHVDDEHLLTEWLAENTPQPDYKATALQCLDDMRAAQADGNKVEIRLACIGLENARHRGGLSYEDLATTEVEIQDLIGGPERLETARFLAETLGGYSVKPGPVIIFADVQLRG